MQGRQTSWRRRGALAQFRLSRGITCCLALRAGTWLSFIYQELSSSSYSATATFVNCKYLFLTSFGSVTDLDRSNDDSHHHHDNNNIGKMPPTINTASPFFSAAANGTDPVTTASVAADSATRADAAVSTALEAIAAAPLRFTTTDNTNSPKGTGGQGR